MDKKIRREITRSSKLVYFFISAKQNSTSNDEIKKSLKELLVDLTLAQAKDNKQNVNVLLPINERIVINFFANGLNNQNLKTIIKARNLI